MGWKKWVSGSGPLVGMLIVQLISTGLQTLSRVILTQGTFIFSLISYRHLLAAFCIAPFAIYLDRGSGAKLSLKVLCWVFLSSLTGITMAMGMFYYGLRDTTATYATNFLSIVPVFTFIFSIILRMEILKLNTKRGKVKVIGTLLCVAGVLIAGLYKGKVFHIAIQHLHDDHHIILKPTKKDWLRGTLLLFSCCVSYATWFIVQAKLLKLYPAKYRATMLICVSASIQTAVVGLFIDRSKSAWQLGWNLQLVTIVYSAVLASASAFYLISWAVVTKGPTFPSMFNPVSLILVALLEALFLGESLFSGSLIGMAMIIVGLYGFLWGSRREREKKQSLPNSITVVGVDGVAPEIADPQLTAIVVPAASPAILSDNEQV